MAIPLDTTPTPVDRQAFFNEVRLFASVNNGKNYVSFRRVVQLLDSDGRIVGVGPEATLTLLLEDHPGLKSAMSLDKVFPILETEYQESILPSTDPSAE